MKRLVIGAVLAVSLGGCDLIPEPNCGKGSGVSGGAEAAWGERFPRHVLQNRQASIRFEFPVMATCQDSADPEVLSPAGEVVTSAVVLDAADENGVQKGGELRFEPRTPGLHTVRLTFKPEGKTVERKLQVIADRAAAAGPELPLWCQGLAKTARGAWLCDARVLRDGEVVQTLNEAPLVAAAGNAVWEYSNGLLRRYFDGGSGALTSTSASPLPAPCCAPEQLLASEDELVLLTVETVYRYVSDGEGTLAAAGEANYDGGGSSPLMFRKDDLLYIATPQHQQSSVCIFRVGASGFTRVVWAGPQVQQFNGCQLVKGVVVGVGDGGLWTATEPAGEAGRTLLHHRPAGETLEPGLALQIPPPVDVVRLPGSYPALPRVIGAGGEWFVPRIEGEAILLEQYAVEAGWEYRGSDASAVWAISAELPARTRVFTR